MMVTDWGHNINILDNTEILYSHDAMIHLVYIL